MEAKKNVMKVMKAGALKCAKDSARAKCLWWCYQPKVPAKIEKLKHK